jgi:hypothetical protein
MNFVQLLKSTPVFKQKIFFGLQFIDPFFKLTHISFNHGAFELFTLS